MKIPDHRQKGVVLLLMLLVFLVTGTTIMLGSFNSRQDVYLKQQAELNNQMQLAKQALLAFAANSSAIYDHERGPGFFPCPDSAYTGNADESCDSSIVNLGRLPEYADIGGNRIFFNSYYADINRRFWYAIAPYYTYSATSASDRSAIKRTFIDSTLPSSLLSLDDTSDIVALIIAPGEALNFQKRDSGPLTAGNFLEGGNEDNDLRFFTSDEVNPDAFNDRIIAITHAELMPYIVSNAALAIKRQLDEDYDHQTIEPKHYPGNPDDDPEYYHQAFDAALAGSSWLGDTATGGPGNEQWAASVIYTALSATQASLQFKGCTGISFILNHGEELLRHGASCHAPDLSD